MAIGIAGMGRAAITSCSTSNPGTTLATLGTGSTSDGCSDGNLTFANLGLDNIDNTYGAPTTSNMYLYTGGSGNNVTLYWDADVNTADLATSGNGGTGTEELWNYPHDSGGVTSDTELSYEVTQTQRLTNLMLGPMPVGTPSDPSGGAWGDTCFASPGCGSDNQTITITMEFCLGQTTITGCPTADEGTITIKLTGTGEDATAVETITACTSTAEFTCSGDLVTFIGSFTEIAVTDTVDILRTEDSTYADPFVLYVANEFDVVPEPSSFVLLAGALAGLGALRLRKRSRDNN